MVKRTAPITPLITLDQMKRHLRVDFADEDALISECSTEAQAHCEALTGFSFTEGEFEESFDAFCHEFVLERTPVTEITSVKYKDASGTEQTLAADQYQFDSQSGRVQAAVNGSFPTSYGIGSVKIAYKAGDPEQVELMLKRIVRNLAATFYEHREFIIANANIQELPVPVRFTSLLLAYARPGFGA